MPSGGTILQTHLIFRIKALSEQLEYILQRRHQTRQMNLISKAPRQSYLAHKGV